jgi:hypothetical protein
MSALGQKQTYAAQQVMSALPPIATSIAYFQTGLEADQGKSINEWRWDAHAEATCQRMGPIEWRCTLHSKDHGRASIHHPSEARLLFINSRLCCAAALPLLTSFLFPSETAWLMLVHSA